MRKISVVITAFSLLTAALGFMLRDVALKTAFDPISGLAIPGDRAATLLIALTVVVAAAACVAGALVSAGYERPRAAGAEDEEGGNDGDDESAPAFAPQTAADAVPASDGVGHVSDAPAPSGRDVPETAPEDIIDTAPVPIGMFTLSALVAGGIIWLAGSVAGLFTAYPAAVAGSYSDLIFSALSALSALSVMYLARGAHAGRSGGFDRFLSVIPPLFFSYWLIRLYMANASNPVVLMYGYECLAVAAAAMCFYFLSGCLYGKSEPGKTVFCMIMTVFLCGVISADGFTLPERLTLGSTLLIALANISPFVCGLVKKQKKSGPREQSA
jgi:hypothetical protein